MCDLRDLRNEKIPKICQWVRDNLTLLPRFFLGAALHRQ